MMPNPSSGSGGDNDEEGPRARSGSQTSNNSARTGEATHRVVYFPNGDFYEGDCVSFPEGDRRHGKGTYTYSRNLHANFRQFTGQWREDKKHGQGVLFYKSGGIYAGEWASNQMQGLGVMLDYVEEPHNECSMPTYRYEGEWLDNEKHGLGVEET